MADQGSQGPAPASKRNLCEQRQLGQQARGRRAVQGSEQAIRRGLGRGESLRHGRHSVRTFCAGQWSSHR